MHTDVVPRLRKYALEVSIGIKKRVRAVGWYRYKRTGRDRYDKYFSCYDSEALQVPGTTTRLDDFINDKSTAIAAKHVDEDSPCRRNIRQFFAKLSTKDYNLILSWGS